ncbi:MAG: hypothetical protein LBQ22_01880 [Bacteroidales bacterium]|jgi:hypothetical protein|nr:hypothetical protein [Bacteroidales bacterium]
MKGIITDINGNLMVSGKSLQIADNRRQIAEHLIIAFTGEYKHAPLLGGNIKQMIAGFADPFWSINIKNQLYKALVEVDEITVNNDEIEIELKD